MRREEFPLMDVLFNVHPWKTDLLLKAVEHEIYFILEYNAKNGSFLIEKSASTSF